MGASISSLFRFSFTVVFLGLSLAQAEEWYEQTPKDTKEAITKLNQYAKHLLYNGGAIQNEVDEQLKKLGLDPEIATKMQDLYEVRISEETDCFWENSFRVFSDYDINGSSDYGQLRRQVQAAVNFLKEVHVSTRGQDLGYFHPRSIDLCPKDRMNGRNLFYQGRKLTIGIPDPTGPTTYTVVSSKTILDMWDGGQIFANEEDDAGLLESIGDKASAALKGKDPRQIGKKMWFLINPIGKIRSAMREFLQKRGLAFRSQIQEAKSREDLLQVTDDNIDSEKVKEDLGGFSPREWLHTLSDQELAELRTLWLKQLSSASLTESIGEAVIEEMQTPVFSEDIEINVSQKGGQIAVENAHFVQASFTLTSARVKRFVTTTVPRKMKINIVQEANVMVSTKDIISAFGNFVLPKSKMVESLSFLEVAEKFQKIREQRRTQSPQIFDKE